MEYILFIMLAAVLYLLLSQQGVSALSSLPSFGRGKRQIILDSCALIDGRIVDLVRTGFVADELVVPKFILSELQMLADGNDSHKRERARFGLEIAAEIQEYVWAQVRIDETNFSGVVATDDKLVKLAKKRRGAVLCTTDYNLSKVAAVEGVRTLNVNELAQGLRPVTLPGEELKVKIVQRGSNGDQGVGYLEDGTMIVVDGAASSVGSTVGVGVDRMHQTVAGKMVFAHMKSSSHGPSKGKPAKRAGGLAKKQSPVASVNSRASQQYRVANAKNQAKRRPNIQ